MWEEATKQSSSGPDVIGNLKWPTVDHKAVSCCLSNSLWHHGPPLLGFPSLTHTCNKILLQHTPVRTERRGGWSYNENRRRWKTGGRRREEEGEERESRPGDEGGGSINYTAISWVVMYMAVTWQWRCTYHMSLKQLNGSKLRISGAAEEKNRNNHASQKILHFSWTLISQPGRQIASISLTIKSI